MRARWRPTFLLPLVGAGLGLAGCSVGAGEPIVIAGCDSVRTSPSGPRCELDFGKGPKEIRLLLRVPPDARVRVLYGGTLVEGGTMRLPSGETRLRINVNKGTGSLWLLAGRSGGLRRVPLHPLVEAPWLEAARADWYRDAPAQAIATLKQHLPSATPEEKAQALGMRGRIYLELNQITEAREDLRASLGGLRAAGLVSAELMNAFYLASLLRDNDRDVTAAEAVVVERRSLQAAQPEMESWFYFHDALNHEAKGELREALRLVEEGQLRAWHFGDTMSLGNFEGMRRRLLRALGRADEVPEDDAARSLSPCWQAYTDAERGYSQLLQREARSLDAAASEPPATGSAQQSGAQRIVDPRPLLMRALETVSKDCKIDGLRLSLVMHLARLDLIEGKIDQAAARLGELQAQQAKSLGLTLELRAFEGDLALAQLERQQGDAPTLLKRARAAFAALKDLAPAADDNESRWRALVGLARLAAREGKPAEARAHFEAAEAYLDQRATTLPLGAGRGSFLGRHERGTAHYLAFLWQQDNRAEALRVMRQARVRGLLSLAGLAATDAQPAFYAERLPLYTDARKKLDAANRALAFAPFEWRPWFEGQQRLAHLEVTRALDQAIKALPNAPAQEAPPLGEALLICHPLPAGAALCLYQDQAGILGAEIAALPSRAAELLEPFGTRLAGVRRLRVLPFGALREVDVHALDLPPGLEVVYALDIPAPPGTSRPVAFGAARTAGLFIDPTDQLPLDLERLASTIGGALAGHGFKTTKVLGSGVDHNGKAVAQVPSASPWQRMLEEPWSVLLFLAHTERRGWNARIGSGENVELWIGDILLARPPGPLVSYIVTCFGAEGREDSGGVEALSLGTAQLLRRGAQVLIAPSREITQEVGAAVLQALSERDPQAVLATPGAELRAALDAARRALSSSEKALPGLAQELAAFRVHVR